MIEEMILDLLLIFFILWAMVGWFSIVFIPYSAIKTSPVWKTILYLVLAGPAVWVLSLTLLFLFGSGWFGVSFEDIDP